MKGILVIALALAWPVHAAMYKWVDAQGRVQYSDTPPPANAKKVEERRITPSTIDTGGLSFAVQEAAKRNPVTLWINDCGEVCSKAGSYLSQRGVPYAVRNPARTDEQAAWKQVSGGDGMVPRLIIGTTQSIKGFSESEWAAALDAAGYPRSAPPLKPKAIPPADEQAAAKPAPQAAQAPAK
jgi:hypothetical protein